MVAISPMLSATAQNTLTLKKVWETIDANSCPHSYNFHMHTIASDGQLTPSQLIDRAIDIGLKGFAITDHHSVEGYKKAQGYLNTIQQNTSNPQFTFWSGVEITSLLSGVDVHILGYAFDPEHSVLKKYFTGRAPQGKDAAAKKVIETIHQAGGLAVLAHPHRYRRSAKELVPLAAKLGIDGVEAYYAYGRPNPWLPTPNKTEEALKLALRHNLYTTCGTDSHGLSLLTRV